MPGGMGNEFALASKRQWAIYIGSAAAVGPVHARASADASTVADSSNGIEGETACPNMST